MIDWDRIDTVLLDMDGTLLDLHYDNTLWNELLPARYSLEAVLRYDCLIPMLEWYVQIPRRWEQSVGVRGRWCCRWGWA